MADSIVFKVEKKQSEEDESGAKFYLWLSVQSCVQKRVGDGATGSLNVGQHRSVPVTEEAFNRVKRGDVLVLAALRETGLERL